MGDWTMLPTPVASAPGVEVWQACAFGTRYRGTILRLPSSAVTVFGLGADWLVAVEPAGGAPPRMWATFSDDRDVLDQMYVEEKLCVRGEDAIALTTLIAEMLGRTPYLRGDPEPPGPVNERDRHDPKHCNCGVLRCDGTCYVHEDGSGLTATPEDPYPSKLAEYQSRGA